MTFAQRLKLFLKGVAMGLCDLVPGISGGTMALITGIYEQLIKAIKDCFSLIKGEGTFKERWQRLQPTFLITLFLGIGTAILAGSRVAVYLLDNHYEQTISFFIGLILASAFTITKHVKKRSVANTATLVLGFALGLSFLLYAPATINPSPLYLFLAGFLAVSALFLPGISGSFILLLLGVYHYLLTILHEPLARLAELATFIAGAILGAAVISYLVTWLFKKDKPKTLHGLLGLVLGALVLPVRNLFPITANPLLLVLLAITGFLTVTFIDRYA